MRFKWFDKFFHRAPKDKGIGETEAEIIDRRILPMFGYYAQDVQRKEGKIKLEDISLEELSEKTPSEQRNIISEFDPIVSKATADFVKYINPSWSFTTDYTSEDPENAPGMDIFREFTERIETYYGGWDTIWNSASRSSFVDGAWFFELVIDEDGMTPVDWRNIDPITAVFRYSENPETGGTFFELGQYKKGRFGVPDDWISFALDPTISYIPVQPNVKNPYGDQILTAAVSSSAIKLKFIRDLSVFLENIAMPSMLASIDRETLTDSYKSINDDELRTEINNVRTRLLKEVKEKKGSKLLVYGSEVKIEELLSGLNGNSLGRLQEVINVFERDQIRSVQSQPILHGRNENISETHSVRQMIDYGTTIRQPQNRFSREITNKWNFILGLNGLPPLARFKFQFSISEEFKQNTEISKLVQETLSTGEDVLQKTIANIETAVAAQLINQEQGQELYQEALAKRSQDDLQSQF